MSIIDDANPKKGNSSTLEARHAAHLEASAIAPHIIEERGYSTIASSSELTAYEPRFSESQRRSAGLLIPVYRLGEPQPYAHMLRPDKPRNNRQGKVIKYEWPRGVPPCLDILPHFKSRLTDPDMTLLITEGAKKADAVASLGEAYLPVNINGVFGWRGRSQAGGTAVLADFEHIALKGRRVILAFDSDVQTNRQVRTALNRLAAWLQSRGASVEMLNLPPLADGSKAGLDDFLASLLAQERLHRIERLVVPYEAGGGVSKAGKHPCTGRELVHPSGWHVARGALIYTNPKTEQVTVKYSGSLAVTALGRDLETGKETATVSFMVRGERREVVMPRQDLAQQRTLIQWLSAQGAAVHERNARDLSAYLTEFAALNDEALPYRYHTSRLGVLGESLVTPGGSLGTEAQYQGERDLRGGNDQDAYPQAIREMLEWRDAHGAPVDVWPLWLTLGAALASPAIARLGLRRSPVVYLSGPSGSGKTTVAQFAVGVWGNPTRLPFHIETPRTSQAGFLQTLSEAGGLAVLIDEAHMASDPKRIEEIVYQFANGQSYTKGTVGGRAAGGEALHGTVILAGEAVVEFAHAGASRRVLHLPTEKYSPLDAGAYSDVGRVRAKVLERAWERGAGHLGLRIAKTCWEHWDTFSQAVRELEAKLAATAEGRAGLGVWAPSIATILATLDLMFEVLELDPPESLVCLGDRIQEALESAAEAQDPAVLMFESVSALVALARHDEGVGLLNGEVVCWRDNKTQLWCIPTRSKAYKERIGPGAAQLYGKTWQTRGWIVPDASGKSTHSAREPKTGIPLRVIKLVGDEAV